MSFVRAFFSLSPLLTQDLDPLSARVSLESSSLPVSLSPDAKSSFLFLALLRIIRWSAVFGAALHYSATASFFPFLSREKTSFLIDLFYSSLLFSPPELRCTSLFFFARHHEGTTAACPGASSLFPETPPCDARGRDGGSARVFSSDRTDVLASPHFRSPPLFLLRCILRPFSFFTEGSPFSFLPSSRSIVGCVAWAQQAEASPFFCIGFISGRYPPPPCMIAFFWCYRMGTDLSHADRLFPPRGGFFFLQLPFPNAANSSGGNTICRSW